MSTSRALAITGKPGPKAKDAKAEKVGDKPTEKITPPVEILRVHSALLLAAESTIDLKDKRPAMTGVFLHRREKVGRAVASDGNRVFIGSFEIPSPVPSWLKDGVILSGEGLRKRVQLIMAMQDTPLIKVSHTKGSGFAEMSDEDGDAVFKVSTIQGTFPDYERLIGPNSFVQLDEDGNVRNREWEPVGIRSSYLKHTGEIAKTLEAGLEKSKRSKTGMAIRAYSGSVESPVVFDFSDWPGAVLLVAPVRMENTSSKETAAIIAPATKLTLAALRAHETRQLAWAEAASDPATKAAHEAKALGFATRIAAIIATMPSMTAALQDDSPKPAAKPEPAATKSEDRSEEAEREFWAKHTFSPGMGVADPENEPEPPPPQDFAESRPGDPENEPKPDLMGEDQFFSWGADGKTSREPEPDLAPEPEPQPIPGVKIHWEEDDTSPAEEPKPETRRTAIKRKPKGGK